MNEDERIVMAPVDDSGPLIAVPDLIGLCSAHGWWFPCEPGEACPEVGCYALVHYYRHSASSSQEWRAP